MKGLRLFLPPFAPDDAGAASLLFPLGGLVVICDAGGCAGNICGFDEPRWQLPGANSAVFSAGLRDMDAILGRDRQLIEKIALAAGQIDASFAAVIGTPVPAVIATDYRALKRLAAKEVPLPFLAIDTDGTHLYDEGIAKAYAELFTALSPEALPEPATLGVLGATPLDLPDLDSRRLRQKLMAEGWQDILCHGLDPGLAGIRRAGAAARNLVVTAGGLEAAQQLEKRFGTPYDVCYPLAEEDLAAALEQSGLLLSPDWQRILIVHEQFQANEIRRILRAHIPRAHIACGTWFLQHAAYAEPQDVRFREEDAFQDYVRRGDFDCIIGDSLFRRALPFFCGDFLPLHHFAVSGQAAAI